MRRWLCGLTLATWGLSAASAVHREVDPFIGTDGTGHVTPGATVPFGMVFPAPDNADRGWRYSAGYQFRHPRILGFSNTHHSGAGIPELGDVLLQPRAGTHWGAQTRDFSARKSEERARPGHYAVRLAAHGVRVELSAAPKVALQRYRFDRPGRVQVLVDLQHGLHYVDGPAALRAEVRARDDGLQGTVWRRNWVERQLSFVVQFSQPVRKRQTLPPRPGDRAPRELLEFDLGRARTLEARIALSTVDEAGAQGNLDTVAGQSFETVRDAAETAWTALLQRIRIQADARTRRLFYSALYRALQHPSDIADADGRVRGPRGEVLQAPGGVYYSTLSLWDTFRASHPLFTLVVPERVPGFVNTLLAHHRQMGWLPLWTSWGRETYTMIGNPALPVIADALVKGLGEGGAIDERAALAAMVETSTRERPDAPAWAQRGWLLLDQHGYLPFDLQAGESVSMTAELGYGDAAVAAVAQRLGEPALAERFRTRSRAWLQLFDEQTRTLRGKDSQGRWRTPFDPVAATSPLKNPGDYTEANAWQYTATPALHDVAGFRQRLGGAAGLEAWLDRFFSLPVPHPDKHLGQEALIGQYAHGNEPSHHISWLYAYTNAPEKGQRLRERIVRRFYGIGPGGLVGNDDVGQMSAWLVFALLGLYPAQPFSGEYVLGQPMLRQAELRLADGRWLRISGRGARALLDGRPVDAPAVRHQDLVGAQHLHWR
ncbi:GH92 family glycosyl hydrolase [Ideonella sp. 4Y11]|uniref:GH92 family glycosyl hydrolase n=1 Tax=Ideonella aquatica TaxID=2824119 RepID=A0A940YJH8_9BURK|nr:GH92 family glycosyl hydrolase [Ideonella aquatica]MBQ0958207.1 GH92 family glycosyl hydrolase [Ideonella aquatica]